MAEGSLDPSDLGGDFVHFPDDSTNTGKRVLYAEEAIDDQAAYIPTTVLVDLAGNVLDLRQVLEAQNDQVLQLLRAVVLRLDLMNAALDHNYSPPDELSEE